MTTVKFDYSGQYLAAGGMDARIYGVKQDWQLLSTLSDTPQKVDWHSLSLSCLADTVHGCKLLVPAVIVATQQLPGFGVDL